MKYKPRWNLTEEDKKLIEEAFVKGKVFEKRPVFKLDGIHWHNTVSKKERFKVLLPEEIAPVLTRIQLEGLSTVSVKDFPHSIELGKIANKIRETNAKLNYLEDLTTSQRSILGKVVRTFDKARNQKLAKPRRCGPKKHCLTYSPQNCDKCKELASCTHCARKRWLEQYKLFKDKDPIEYVDDGPHARAIEVWLEEYSSKSLKFLITDCLVTVLPEVHRKLALSEFKLKEEKNVLRELRDACFELRSTHKCDEDQRAILFDTLEHLSIAIRSHYSSAPEENPTKRIHYTDKKDIKRAGQNFCQAESLAAMQKVLCNFASLIGDEYVVGLLDDAV